MVWFFERDGESMKLETRYDDENGEFVLITDSATGRSIERFKGVGGFRLRLEALEKQLATANWLRRDGPLFLHDGWKL